MPSRSGLRLARRAEDLDAVAVGQVARRRSGPRGRTPRSRAPPLPPCPRPWAGRRGRGSRSRGPCGSRRRPRRSSTFTALTPAAPRAPARRAQRRDRARAGPSRALPPGSSPRAASREARSRCSETADSGVARSWKNRRSSRRVRLRSSHDVRQSGHSLCIRIGLGSMLDPMTDPRLPCRASPTASGRAPPARARQLAAHADPRLRGDRDARRRRLALLHDQRRPRSLRRDPPDRPLSRTCASGSPTRRPPSRRPPRAWTATCARARATTSRSTTRAARP